MTSLQQSPPEQEWVWQTIIRVFEQISQTYVEENRNKRDNMYMLAMMAKFV